MLCCNINKWHRTERQQKVIIINHVTDKQQNVEMFRRHYNTEKITNLKLTNNQMSIQLHAAFFYSALMLCYMMSINKLIIRLNL